MEKGYNSDVDIAGTSYHVQTEDWGKANPYLVSRVYCNGAILRSVKTHYEQVIPQQVGVNSKNIQIAMNLQHKKVIELLREGKLT